jgi:hypothetical protein
MYFAPKVGEFWPNYTVSIQNKLILSGNKPDGKKKSLGNYTLRKTGEYKRIVEGAPLPTETGISLIILPLAGGPLLRVATIRRTTDTHYRYILLHFSHNERTPVQISLQYLQCRVR